MVSANRGTWVQEPIGAVKYDVLRTRSMGSCRPKIAPLSKPITGQHVALTHTVPPSWQSYSRYSTAYLFSQVNEVQYVYSGGGMVLLAFTCRPVGLCLAPPLSRPPHASSEPSFMHSSPVGIPSPRPPGSPWPGPALCSISAVPFPPSRARLLRGLRGE